MRLSCLYIDKTTQKGRGVFTNEAIPADTLLEIAPVIVMSLDERKLIDQTLLHDYIFLWGEKEDRCAMALGWIPVFNHSYQSNCEYLMDFEEEAMFIKTIRAIEAGEELTINYNGDWNNNTPVWFDAQ
ncbi:MAG: SET domain-containing protein-lysine N-methyltransferase [Sphingobacteriales bacterium]|nr:SET domain-containing protein-lysine N-methyltransferase [Sphingobacteriales bacterium]